MKRNKYSESQISTILKEGESGIPVPDLCRKHGMSSASYYKWRSQYAGMDASHMKQLRELTSENARLKKLYAKLCYTQTSLRRRLQKSNCAILSQRDGASGNRYGNYKRS